MTIVSVLLKQIIIMFILMFIGFVLFKEKIISDQGSKDLGKILLYLIIPTVIVKNFMIEPTAEKVNELIFSILISVVCMIVSIVIAYLFFGKKDGISCFSSAFSNAGFIGIPLVLATLGGDAVFYVSMMIVLVNALQWTFGVYVMTNDKSFINPKKIITNPIVIAVVIGLIFFCLNIKVPKMVEESMTIISNMNTPVAMIVSGVYLAQADLKKMFLKLNNYYVSLVRLIVIPVACIALCKLLPNVELKIILAILIAASTPVGSNVAIFSQTYNLDYKKAIEHVCISTLLCLVTLPVVIYIAMLVI